jgi:hypothetical protein
MYAILLPFMVTGRFRNADIGPRTLKAKLYAPVDQQLARYHRYTLIIHLLSIPSYIAPIRELILRAFRAKSLHDPHEPIHALFHIILAIETGHLCGDIARMDSERYDIWSDFFQVLRLGLREVVQSAFGESVAGVAAYVVYCC